MILRTSSLPRLTCSHNKRQDPFGCLINGLFSDRQVVSDARRLSDLQWFCSEFPRQTRSVRVECSEETREQRGWSFTAGETGLHLCLNLWDVGWLTCTFCASGVDDAESECGLDRVQFDWVITNEADAPSLDQQLQPILTRAKEAARPLINNPPRDQ